MQSKTSFFNKTVFKKNLTRFAPAWLLYTLCLILGMAMLYVDDGQEFWFASRMGELIQYSSLINLFYGPLVAMLLFGDLYNSRMCNALHAMPLKRGCWFGTNVISGLTFSLLPTAILCALSVPLLMNTCVVDAQWIALWTFLGMNLTFLCFFGIAVFSAMCAGNRFGMAAVYALLNGGAYVGYFLVDTIYTPMLYGVITPTMLVDNLTPIANLIEASCVDMTPFFDLLDLYRNNRADMTANFWLLKEGWMTVLLWAVVGAVFLLLGLLLYRRRKLECAGDTMATKALEPVFQICISVCTAAFASLFLEMFFGYYYREMWQKVFLACGLLVGWFAGRMLIERTVRVFRLKNWLGLAALAAVVAGSLALTHYDVFGIEPWTPDAQEVKSVTFGYSNYRGMSEELTEKEDIEAVIRLQELALEDKLPEGGSYPVVDGVALTWEQFETLGMETPPDYRYASEISIYYELENGRTVSRRYFVWGDEEEAQIVNEYLSRWDTLLKTGHFTETVAENVMPAKEDIRYITIWGEPVPEEYCNQESVESLLAAIQADCEDRTMTQRETFHTGHFEYWNEEYEQWEEFRSFWIDIQTESGGFGDFYVFADSENTLKWLMERDLLEFEVFPENGYNG